jgi:YCII-related domain
MATFVFSYRSPHAYNPSPESMAEWMAWFDSMGDHLVDLGKPTFVRSQIGDCDTSRTELGGYSIIQSDDLEAAAAIAKGCPALARGGGVEIGQLAEVPTPQSVAG